MARVTKTVCDCCGKEVATDVQTLSAVTEFGHDGHRANSFVETADMCERCYAKARLAVDALVKIPGMTETMAEAVLIVLFQEAIHDQK